MATTPDTLSVWRLLPGHDDYAGLVTVELDDMDRIQPFDGSPMAAHWTPIPARWETEDGRYPIPDVADIRVPALAERGMEALGDLIRDEAEALPLAVADGPAAWLLNVTHLSDALDEEASEIVRFPDGGFMEAATHVFDPGRLAGHTIFKLRQDPVAEVYVTGAVVERIRERGLTGARLKQAWSAPS